MQPPPSPYEVPGSVDGPDAPPGFLVRLVGLPFRPDLWRASAEYPALAIALPLLVLTFLVDSALGFYYAEAARQAIYKVAERYAASADPLLFEDGRFSLRGTRIFQMTEGNFSILVDPAESVPESEMTTETYLIVRENGVVVRTTQERAFVEADTFADERFELGAFELRQIADELVRPMIIALFAMVLPIFNLLMSIGCSALAGALLFAMGGRPLGLDFAACWKVSLAVCTAVVLATSLLPLLGIALPLLLQALLWPPLVALAGGLALATRPEPSAL